MNLRTITLLAGLLTLAVSAPAFADKGENPKADDRAEQGRHKRMLPGQHAPEAASGSAAPGAASAAPSAALGQKRRELTDEEKKQRKEHMAELRAKWGEMLKQPGVKEEMHMHLSRNAKLRHILKLAKEDKKEGVAKRAEAALKREHDRHEKRMAELKSSAGPAATTAPAAPTAVSTGGAK